MPYTESADGTKRPLSPHLQVYKLPYNAIMSITGRAVGIALSKALSLALLWVIAVVAYPPLYDASMAIFMHPAFGYLLLAAAFAVFFYLGNGVRHVLWDFVIGVHHKTGKLTGNIVLVLAALLTVALWQFGGGL